MRATRAIVRLDHLKSNLDQIRRHIGSGVRICLAVKADAYGHGIVEIGRAASDHGVEYLAVATSDEGTELRNNGVEVPILLYSLASPREIPDIVRHRISPVIADEEQAALYETAAHSQGTRAAVHVKIDTGMGRIGCRPDETVRLARRITSSPSLLLAGISTHLASSDMADPTYTNQQLDLFRDAVERVRRDGIDPGIVHAANSGGVLSHPEGHFDMVRPGIIAYGYRPSPESPASLQLTPVMEVRSQVVFLKRVGKGEAISYGMTWRAPRETWIGTIPIGYGDGYNRLLSNRAEVLIGGRRYPVVGRVCMDQIMVDLGASTSVKRYDEAILFGFSEGAPDAEELAALCETIPYEITCNVSKRVRRNYVS